MINFKYTLACTSLITLAHMAMPMIATADDYSSNKGRFYAKVYGGANFLSDENFNQSDIATPGATGDGSFDTGWGAGAAAGYFITNHIAAEIAWDYRSNENDDINFSDGSSFDDGNYASNIFFINGYYHFDPVKQSRFSPYIGAGIGYVQEIDVDLEAGGVETSYSSDGEVAAQLIAGTSYALNDHWDLNADLRYVRAWSMDLKNEDGIGQINDIDYDPVSVMAGVTYKF